MAIYQVSRQLMPNIWDNIDAAISSGAPSVLHRCTNTDRIADNRSKAILRGTPQREWVYVFGLGMVPSTEPGTVGYNNSRVKEHIRQIKTSQHMSAQDRAAAIIVWKLQKLSWDEYPFASTYEGGIDSQMAAVPVPEQCAQGGQLGAFYLANGITDGAAFTVELVD